VSSRQLGGVCREPKVTPERIAPTRSRPVATRSRRRLPMLAAVAIATALSPLTMDAVASATTSWTIVKTPNTTMTQAQLNAVACISATSCIGAGQYTDSNDLPAVYLATFDGTSWAGKPGPTSAEWDEPSALSGISCPSATFCSAVGYYVDFKGVQHTLAESWHGTNWSVNNSPAVSGSSPELSSVSCVFSGDCMAVGTMTSSSNVAVPLVEHWNGSAWSVLPAPRPTSLGSFLKGVSCTASNFCAAAGYYMSSATTKDPLVELWGGSKWQIVPAPTPGTAQEGWLDGVACTSATACTAVGSYTTSTATGGLTLALAYHGSNFWTVVKSPNPTTEGAGLLGVSCRSGICLAVGTNKTAPGSVATLAEEWTGSSWAIRSTPALSGFPGDSLNAVSCISATSCAAVGQETSLLETEPVAESLSGTSLVRRAVTSPRVTTSTSFSNLSCLSATDCVAVGAYTLFQPSFQSTNTLAARWNGKSWTTMATPSPGLADNHLFTVSCASPSFCEAVGYYVTSANAVLTLAEGWNGTKWSLQSTPNAGTANDVLSDVSCKSATFCSAVGSYESGSTYFTLAENWNGTKWSILPTPAVGTISQLFGVSCTASTQCTAVGWDATGSAAEKSLVMRWNGSKWTVQTSPNEGTQNNVLLGVTCTGASACIAVGNYNSSTDPLAMSWNGAAWKLQTAPTAGTFGRLTSVSCTSASTCTAVGDYFDTSGYELTLVQVLSGGHWKNQPSPSPEPSVAVDTGLTGVSCLSTGCLAVGQYATTSFSTGRLQTIAETGPQP
jgi:hypothetical protein